MQTPSANHTEPFRMSRPKNETYLFSRRTLLKGMGLAPLLLRPAPFYGAPFLFGSPTVFPNQNSAFPFSDIRLTPHYPAKSPLEDVLRLVAPEADLPLLHPEEPGHREPTAVRPETRLALRPPRVDLGPVGGVGGGRAHEEGRQESATNHAPFILQFRPEDAIAHLIGERGSFMLALRVLPRNQSRAFQEP